MGDGVKPERQPMNGQRFVASPHPKPIAKEPKKARCYISGMDEPLDPDHIQLPDYLEIRIPEGQDIATLGILEALVRDQQLKLDLALGTATGSHTLWFLVTDGPNKAHYQIATHGDIFDNSDYPDCENSDECWDEEEDA